MTHRKDLREAVAEALKVSVWGLDYTQVRSWGQALGEDEIPAFGVSVVRELVEYIDKETEQFTFDLRIAFCREGNRDIEDDLDDDAEEVIRLTRVVIEDTVFNVRSREIEFEVTAQDGAQRIGVCVITFDCDMRSDNC